MAFGTKKRETRKSLRQSGWITFEGGFAARPCVVQDMSTSGAKITIEDSNSLPAELRLAFSPAKWSGGAARRWASNSSRSVASVGAAR